MAALNLFVKVAGIVAMLALCGCNETTDKPAETDKCAQLEMKMLKMPEEVPSNHTVPPEMEKAKANMFQKMVDDIVKACKDGTKYDACANAGPMVEKEFAAGKAMMEAEMQTQINTAIEECKKTPPFGQLGENWVDTLLGQSSNMLPADTDKCAQLEKSMTSSIELPTNHVATAEEEASQKEMLNLLKETHQKKLDDMVKACRDGTKYDQCADAGAMIESVWAAQIAMMEAGIDAAIETAIEECKKTSPFAQLGDNWVDTLLATDFPH